MTLSRKTRQEMHDNALIDTAVSMCFLAAGLVLNGEFGFGEVALEALEKHAKDKGIEVNWK